MSTDRVKAVQAALRKLSDDELLELAKECRGVSPRTHTLQSCVSALDGIYVDVELCRRKMARMADEEPQP